MLRYRSDPWDSMGILGRASTWGLADTEIDCHVLIQAAILPKYKDGNHHTLPHLQRKLVLENPGSMRSKKKTFFQSSCIRCLLGRAFKL